MASPRKTAGRVLLALLVIAAFGLLVALGTWQVQRLHWKEALVAAATERPNQEAVPAPGPRAWPDIDLEDWQYRRVSLTGTFRADEAYAFISIPDPKGPFGGPGYFVMAPFETEAGWVVLVNRGFVPQDRRAPDTRPASAPPEGTVTVEGVVRPDDPPNFLTPAPDPRDNTVFSRDIGTLAAILGVGVGRVAPYTVDLVAAETPASGLPQAGEYRVTFRNNHLGYALTWYGLAACLAGVVAASVLCGRTRGGRRAQG